MKKWICLFVLTGLSFNVMAQGIFTVTKVREGTIGLISGGANQGLDKGQRLEVLRSDGRRETRIGEATIILCKNEACAVKLTRAVKGYSLNVGDRLHSLSSDLTELSRRRGFGVGVSIRASSLGFGGELGITFHPKLGARIGFNTFSYGLNGENAVEEYSYEARLKLHTLTVFIDWYPWASSFHFSSGMINNQNAIILAVTPTGTYDIGVKTFTPQEIGLLNGTIDFDKHVPYLGLGFGNPARGKFGFVFDLGLIFQNSPHVDFTATGIISPTESQGEVVAENLKNWKAYGVVSFGIRYHLL